MRKPLPFSDQLKKSQIEIDSYLDRVVLKPYQETEPTVLAEAIRYALFAGGKRIRPILVMLTAELFGKKIKGFLPLAAAVEILHTYSLIHDDLPAMDNDDLRRGLPTLHKKYSEAIAILAGDTMQTLAYEVMLNLDQKIFSCQTIIAATKIFAKSSGYLGMAGGQVLDVSVVGQKIDSVQLMEIHHLKTGALMQGCVLAAATLAGASPQEFRQLEIFSRSFGIIFQIKDDILDITGDEAKLGKPVGSDARNQKITFPSLLGIPGCEKMMRSEENIALQALKIFGNSAKPLENLLKYIISRES